MTAPPATTTYRFYRGTTFTTDPIILDDGSTPPAPIDLTGYTGVFDVWREDDDPSTETPLFHLTSSDTLVITPAEGKLVATIDATETLVAVDPDGEMWPFRLTLTNTNATPDTVERVLTGWIVAQP